MRRPVALVLVAAALLAAPTPEAVAQTQPRELWRQFPLETRRSTPRAAAEHESTRQISMPTVGGTPGEGTDRAIGPAQTAGIVLTMALVLMLTTGVLAYALRGQFEFGTLGRRRRLALPFADFLKSTPVEAPPHAKTERPERREPNRERVVRDPGRPRRHAKRAAVARITSEVDALRAELDGDTAPKKPESAAQDRIERAPAAKSEHDERERLKEKLGTQPAYTESTSHDERQTLKEKLAMQATAPKGMSTTPEELELKAKLAKRAAFATAERETAEAVASKEKLSGAGAAAKRETVLRTQLVDHGPRPTSEGKADLHADTPVSAGTRRSTIFQLAYEHGSNLALIGLVVIMLALLLLNIAVFFGIGVEQY